MASEEDKGAMSGDEGDKKEADAPKTFTQSELDAAVKAGAEASAKQATTESYRKHQSALDVEKNKSKTATDELDRVKKEAIKNLPEAERQAAMIEDVYERLNNPAPSPKEDAGAKGQESSDTSLDSPESAQAEAQKKLREIAKSKGLDPDKLDFSDPAKFIDGIKAQLEDNDSDEEEDAVDTGTGSLGSKASNSSREAMLKADPSDLMRSGYKNRKRVGRK